MISEQDCLFCKIVSDKLPSAKIYEDSHTVAILDINPAVPGHALVIPKKHSLNIHDIKAEDMDKATATVKTIANRMRDSLGAKGINVLHNAGQYAGQIVMHTHFHVIPRYDNDGIHLKFPRAQLSDEDFKGIQKKLSQEKKEEPDFSGFY